MSTQYTTAEQLQSSYERVRTAYNNDRFPSLAERKNNLTKLKNAILAHQDAVCAAAKQDFGCRAIDETMLSEIMPAIHAIKYAQKNVKSWMRPQHRKLDPLIQPAKAQINYQPVGVVGIIAPWNYPFSMIMQPLICALAAGNRALVKQSEFTPNTNKVVQQILADAFDDDHVAAITGEADIAAQFSSLPFDHILFTGSTQVGKHVMRAAAENLTPVTLELGGKSPTIIDDSIGIGSIVDRIVFGKSLNAGQTCTAPDYIMCPSTRIQEFVDAYTETFASMYPDAGSNADYTSVINERQQQRLQSLVDDAEAKGAKVIKLQAESTIDSNAPTKFLPHIVINPTDDMRLMQEEIFGPILPIIGYNSINEAIDYINARPRPLALYLFSNSNEIQQMVINNTHSGGVGINETLLQAAVDSLPFGGVGDSGMGHYHGHEGFLTFSKAKSILSKGRINGAKSVYAPYDSGMHRFLRWMTLR